MDSFNIVAFNGVWFVMMGIFAALLIVSSVLLRKASRKTKRWVLAGAFIFTFVAYWAYKVALSLDTSYEVILERDFSWWAELPLQLCNINIMLIPVACILDNKRLYAFCFFIAPLAAFMAIAFPSAGFHDCSIFLVRNLGFYFTHWMIVIGGIAIASFGLYRPVFRDIPRTYLTLLCISAVVFGFDCLLNYGCGYYFVNYFFALDPEGISILELFYNLVPVPGLYILVTGLTVLTPYILLVTGIFELCGKKKNKKTV